jgi:hypothetical protein
VPTAGNLRHFVRLEPSRSQYPEAQQQEERLARERLAPLPVAELAHHNYYY